MGGRAKAPLALLAIFALGGCGSDAASTSSTYSAPPATATKQRAQGKGTQAKPPKDASPALRSIRRQFTAPKPDPRLKGSAQAIKAGERACKGKTPSQVKAQYFSAARSNLAPAQIKTVERIGAYEAREAKDPSFAAGQLAAVVYAASQPLALNQFAYQGCVYALALGVR
jgi:hypothetical protein